MSLADYVPEAAEIKFRGKTLCTVRGLNLEDLTELVSLHLGDIEQGFTLWQRMKVQMVTRAGWDAFVLTLIREAPGLVSEIISVAADEPDQAAAARKLPVSIQIMAMSEIVRITFEEAGGLKNLLADLTTQLREALPEDVRQAMKPPIRQEPLSSAPIGGSAKT